MPTIHPSLVVGWVFCLFVLPFKTFHVPFVHLQHEEKAARGNKPNSTPTSVASSLAVQSSAMYSTTRLPSRGGSQFTLASQWESKKVMTSPIATEAPNIRVLISPSLFLVRRILTFGNWAI